MSIKTTRAITIAAALPPWGSESTLQGIFGFAWNVAAAGAARLSPSALLYAHVTYEAENGLTADVIAVRPGVFYRTGQRMQMVRLFCASSAAGANLAAFEVATKAEDFIGSVQPPRRRRLLWDSGSIAAGALITSPILDLREVESLLVHYVNADVGVARNVIRYDVADDGVTAIGNGTAFSCAAASSSRVGMTAAAAVGNLAGLSTYMRLEMLAGGVAAGRLTVWSW